VWLAYRVVGEADGRVKYTDPRDPAEALVKEKARQLRIEEIGFVVVRWTGAEVLHRPDVVIARIARQAVARVPDLPGFVEPPACHVGNS
jgi:very-short-patch-repair endonuclease